ncbi:MAG: hypothetical protein ACFCGT_02030 [Sandaracinaceae bacterium]
MSELVVRRVVVAIDSDDRSTASVVRRALSLATQLEADLEGLFVEDETLLGMAASDLGRHVSGHPEAESYGARQLEREWRAVARVARRVFEQEARRATFAVARARPEALLEERLARGGLVVVGWRGRLSSAPRQAPPVQVVVGRGASSERGLAVARRVAPAGTRLRVWLSPEVPEAFEVGLRASLAGTDEEPGPAREGRIRVARLPADALAALRRAMAEEGSEVRVVPADHPLAALLTRRSVRAPLPGMVVLVR